MPKNPDPDDDNVLDFSVFRGAMLRHFTRDQHLDADERKLLSLFDRPYESAKQRHVVRKAFDRLMRNGVSRYTTDMAKAAHLTLVIKDGYPAEITPFPGTWHDGKEQA